MSASEKLKALEFGSTADDGEIGLMGHEALLVLRDALPQIVALVEAAEKGVRWESVTSSIGIEDGRKLWDALAALEEALS